MSLPAQSALAVVITTVRPPTEAVTKWALRLGSVPRSQLVIVGDAKGPSAYDVPSVAFLGLPDQAEAGLALAAELPLNHYARKNLGYLHAIAGGATCIYETDDDNAPADGWQLRDVDAPCVVCAEPPGWINVYRHFTSEMIWPRGIPLAFAHPPGRPVVEEGRSGRRSVQAPVQQGLADGSPDVDAVWRLLLDRPIVFERAPSMMLVRGQWCPFNSQSTWWWPPAFPLMYLPSTCSFRMTDIWRSLVAQRCLWELGTGVVFHSAEVYQDRNAHNLLRDLEDEVPGYLGNEAIADRLMDLHLREGADHVAENARTCYAALVQAGYLDASELPLQEVFLEDLERVQGGRPTG